MLFDHKTEIVGRYLLPLMLACLASPVWSEDDRGGVPVEKRPDVEKPQTQSRDGKKNQPPRTPRKFTPSEEISADSAVSFPVDI